MGIAESHAVDMCAGMAKAGLRPFACIYSTLLQRGFDQGFQATVVQKVGPVKATFEGSVTLSDVVPETSYTISGEGKGGVAGFAKGGAQVSLSDAEGGGTDLHYDVEAKVGGKIAQLGSRLIDSFARKMADQFFERFQAHVEGANGKDSAA